MSEPKPLTKERRAQIEEYRRRIDRQEIKPRLPIAVVDEILAAEAFWREAVKHVDERAVSVMGWHNVCAFCAAEEQHEPDCPWLLAQDEK